MYMIFLNPVNLTKSEDGLIPILMRWFYENISSGILVQNYNLSIFVRITCFSNPERIECE